MAHDKSATEERALALLGQGLSSSVVASALGVTDSRISQMLAESSFAAEVQKLRFENLQQSTEIDSKYNNLEHKLLEKLEKVLPLVTKPRDLLQAIHIVNGAKRRGQVAPDQDSMNAKVVQLSLPNVIQQKFITNNYQQVVEVRDETGRSTQTLVTASSGSLGGMAERMLAAGKQEPKALPEPGDAEVTQEGSGEGTEGEGSATKSDLLSSL